MSRGQRSLTLSLFAVCCVFAIGAMAQNPQTVAVTPNLNAQAAVELVTALFTINPVASVGGSGKPLDKNGSWGVRAALPDERPAVCETAGASCSEVVYHAGQPEVLCTWTVLFPAMGNPKVARINEASARYMMVESQSKRPKDAGDGFLGLQLPKMINSGSPEMTPEMFKYGHVIVKLTFIVDTQGNVAGIRVAPGPDDAHKQSAVNALKQSKFSPGLLDGRPQSIEMSMETNFQ